jgi:hypothetical protein
LTVNVCPAIVAVPLRAAPVFAAADTVTLPLPVPLPPPATVSQGAFAVAVQAHVAAEAVTATVPVPPSAGMPALAGAIVKVHGGGGAAAWFTVNVWPAIVSVPLRAGPVLAATLTVTTPLAVPLPPLAIVSHAAFGVAVHAHVAVTPTVVVPPSAATLASVGRIENVHVCVGAGWLTVNVRPPIDTVPLRAGPVLAAAATVTLPFPVPLAPALIVSHGALDVAVHAHDEADAVTATVPLPPSAAIVALAGAMVKLHAAGAACVTVTGRPATVNVLERSPPVFAATV